MKFCRKQLILNKIIIGCLLFNFSSDFNNKIGILRVLFCIAGLFDRAADFC